MDEAERVIAQLLAERGPGKTICPSEAARRLAGSGDDWRAQMERVHLATDAMMRNSRIAISWKGERLTTRAGPYRITQYPEGDAEK